MEYYSLNQKAPKVSFREAVIQGIAPDRGLYFPEEIPVFPDSFWKQISSRPFKEVARDLILPFVKGSIPENVLKDILHHTLDFEFPLVRLNDRISALELYHGPTMAFKDVGSRFMARCLGYFSEGSNRQITVLVATSGDTGGAVANGFLGVPGVQVVILYPEGKVSDIQERQLTTLGKNISALKVRGNFDDCQQMVKRAFLEEAIRSRMQLTSANSINVARWIPQLLYFVSAISRQAAESAPVFSVPSGNFGNICAGMLARQMGMPASGFIAATNVNDTVPRYMAEGTYEPKPAVATISNAMDVADPSNFIRIRQLFENRFENLKSVLSAYSYTDTQTRKAIVELHQKYGYTADPHGAIGYLGLTDYLKDHPGAHGIFLETAHPIKFRKEVENCIGKELEIPPQIQQVLNKEKSSVSIASFEELQDFLLSMKAGYLNG